MADHYRKSVELLEEVDDLREQLARAYRAGGKAHEVASLHDNIRSATKRAEVHSNLAIAQALHDLPVADRPVTFAEAAR